MARGPSTRSAREMLGERLKRRMLDEGHGLHFPHYRDREFQTGRQFTGTAK